MIESTITYSHETPDKQQYVALFKSTGWNEEYQLDDSRLHESIQHSWCLVSAWDGDRLIGFGRAISDGILHALLVDIIILPEYKGKGIGSTVLMKLVERCREARIPDIQLFCAKGQSGFYLRHGFVARPNDAPGMQYAGE
jgi:GNAT superfamily N-acetyltransferase